MKRIMLYYDNYCGQKSRGGTEVATARIAKALKATGEWEVFNACKVRRCDSTEEIYAAVKVLPHRTFVSDLARFIKENEIDVVVNMGRFYRHPKLKKAIQKSCRDTRLLFMHHFAPGNESKKHTYAAGWHLLKLDPNDYKYWLRASVYPIFKLQRRLSLKGMYRKILDDSDKVILLSDGYKEDYLKKAGSRRNAEKLVAIPNIYDAPGVDKYRPKEKRVLVLSRMDEIQKRITLALRIWKKIEEKDDLEEWWLDIVGTGDDMKAIKKFACKLGVKRVVFHGWQDSEPYLDRASILMSTSDYEGLPLSMIEAQVYGCVPIAFNSYASIRDVVEDGKTGVIVDSLGDIDAYVERLSALMRDGTSRSAMAATSSRAAARFSASRIAVLWRSILG